MTRTKPFEKCPICGGDLAGKEVEKLMKGGVNSAIIRVRVDVCLHCGGRLYSQETVKLFEEIRRKLERKEGANFQMIGQSFQVTASDSV